MKNTLLHLSHTDISRDSRILKEMKALRLLADSNSLEVVGLGVAEIDASAKAEAVEGCRIVSTHLLFRKLWSVFRPIRPVLIFSELIFRFLWAARNVRPLIVHCHDTLVLPIALIISFFADAKLIYDAHELESNRNSQGKISSAITRFVERVAWPHIDLLISVSPSINEWYVEQYGSKENIVILNSPELLTSSAEAVDGFGLRKRLEIAEGEKVFVYLGILAPGRGIQHALNVFSRDDIEEHLVFVGWGELRPIIEKYSFNNKNIHVLDPVEHKKVVPLVRECDFGLCMIEAISLSDYLCLPNKLFEYCFAGLPVLSSDFPNFQGWFETTILVRHAS